MATEPTSNGQQDPTIKWVVWCTIIVLCTVLLAVFPQAIVIVEAMAVELRTFWWVVLAGVFVWLLTRKL